MKRIKSKRRTISIIGFVVLVTLIVLSYSSLAAEDKINLSFKGVDLRDAFRALADVAGMNVITDSTVKGRVTVNLKDISFIKSIELLTMTNGLGYRVVGNTILIGNPESLRESFDKKVTEVFKLENANPEEVKNSLSILLREDSLKIDNRTKSIIVTAYEDEMDQIKKVIKELDKPNKQVVIEARIEDISRDKLDNMGIDWSFATGTTSNGSSIIWDNNDNEQVKKPNQFEIGNIGIEYQSVLAALNENGDSVTLANPHLATVDGKEAIINIGQEIPVIRETKDDDEVTREVEFRTVGTILKLTPRVNDGAVTLSINQEVSEVNSYVENMPVINTKNVTTNIMVEDGKTIAIGGLISDKQIEKLSKVPLLGDMPILGKIFSKRRVDNEKRELVIFITPKIIDTEKDNSNELWGEDIKPFRYEVKKADTFWSIAKLFKVSFAKIMVYNNIDSPEKLEVGQGLLIPVPKNRYYRLKASDSINNIAKKYDVSIDDLKRINGLEVFQSKEDAELVLPVAVEEVDK
ncbi:type IV pilus assembly protein PilQ [Orenia metallireducens]|uniref:Type IV pilus assembly protein PilQ n=1 Tax=Orenia metallireducens TaxID=1413210 RepID=A0A285GVT5_9FIRM|nr:LysM peptidoglycan-binding domain-containing protein [Orenia metallireducens]PRX31132.1 type IV pilus assembly protein PilQ [Orenia metallireducens]SNY27404.1 type IV pilus assembly protein PilQ [Orenia metallireducens]